MSVKILFFASFKEKVMKGEEVIDLPEDVRTVNDLEDFLSERDPLMKSAFEEMPRLRCAVNQEMAKESTLIKDGDEIAFFPPVTGG